MEKFELGKKYMFSMRKFKEKYGKDNVKEWNKDLVGLKFVATKEVIERFAFNETAVVPIPYEKGLEYVVNISWCIEVK